MRWEAKYREDAFKSIIEVGNRCLVCDQAVDR
jgi:hypothetical protein